ncbi:MAG TPA: acetyl-CoA C-acetyltransferase [Planctomycetota bacterium]|nr:acetyl-CoA C-acetyltransferase [Planctomycetota bacterium]
MSEAFLASAVRTPLGKFLGALASLPAPKLGAHVVREAVRRSGIPPQAVEEVLMGSVLQAGLGQNPARQAALGGGLGPNVGAVTVNKVCGSGLKSILFAAQAIRAGDLDVAVAGGMESMTNAPYLLPEARRGTRLGDAPMVDALVHDGLWDVYNDFHMGTSCELVAERFRVTRRDMDEFAAESHRRAIAAAQSGAFRSELSPIETPGEKGQTIPVAADEGPRPDSTVERLSKLKPAFRPDGLVTAGNSSQISDGASALVVVSEKALQAHGLAPLARVTGYATVGVDPKWVLVSTIDALRRFDEKNPWKAASADLIEINEAFAGSTVAAIRELGLDPARVNVNGGAVALGHPIGASGARIVVTLLYALLARGLKRGVATLCMGGGNGLALGIERP